MTTKKDNDAAEATEELEVTEEEVLEEESAEEEQAEEQEKEFEFAEDPTFELDYKGECAYEVKVTIPPANEDKQSAELFDELENEAEVPGFRKGRAPRKLIEKKFAKVVRNEASQKLIGASFQKLIKDEKLRPINYPDIEGLDEAKDRKEGEALSCTFKFEVAPRCELGQYRGIAVERPVVKVDADDVEETMQNMCSRFATFETLEDAKAEENDQVIIDFKGVIDGEEFAGGSAENYPYILGSKRFFPEFEKALEGVKAGDELTCDVNFPEDYSNEELKGKKATFAITVHEIKRRQVPELDDDLAKQIGYESVEDMREKIEKGLSENAKSQSDQVAEANALRAIIADSTFELPKTLVESSAEDYYQQEIRQMIQMRVPPSTIRDDEEKIRERTRERAVENIKSFVVINEIGEAEGVEVTEADFSDEAESIQERTGMEMDVVANYLAQDEQRDQYERRIYRRKAMAIVMDNAKITDKEVTEEELSKQEADADV